MSREVLRQRMQETDKAFRENLKAIVTSDLSIEEQDRKIHELTDSYREQVQGITLASLLTHSRL